MINTNFTIKHNGFRVCMVGLLLISAVGVSGCVSTNEVTLKPVKLEKTKEKKPTVNSMYALSRLYIVQEEDKRGEAVLIRIIEEYPGFTPAYSDLAKIRIQQGRVPESIELLNMGLSVNINDPVLHNNLGLSHLVMNDYSSALVSFESAYNIDQNNKKYQANIALAYGLMGNTEQAYAFYRKVMPEEDIEHNFRIINAMRDSNSPVSVDILELNKVSETETQSETQLN